MPFVLGRSGGSGGGGGAPSGPAGGDLGGTYPNPTVDSRELSYVEYTSTVAISATTPTGANTVVTAAAVVVDGSTPIIIEFYSPQVEAGSGGAIGIVLYDGSTQLGIVGRVFASIIVPSHCVRRLTPSAGSHTYSWRAYRDTANGNVQAGNGAAGNNMPGFIRITKA